MGVGRECRAQGQQGYRALGILGASRGIGGSWRPAGGVEGVRSALGTGRECRG